MIGRITSTLLAIVTTLCFLAVVPASPAHAQGEAMLCAVDNEQPLRSCISPYPAGFYFVTFVAVHRPGNTTHEWNTGGLPIVVGCGSSQALCQLYIKPRQQDQYIEVSAVLTTNGQSVTVSATAIIQAVCQSGSRYEFC